MSLRPNTLLALGCLGLVATSSARAEHGPEPADTRPAPLALTISGGGTKGAYMAGHLYYMGLVSHLAKEPLAPKIATGASAGAINALLTAFTACTGVDLNPRQSLYWRAWSDAGLEKTFREDLTRATGVFTTEGFRPVIEELRALWEGGLPESCDFVVGVAITRAKARMVVPAPGMPALPKSREAVLVRIQGRGLGQPARLTNVLDPHRATAELALPLDQGGGDGGDGAKPRPFDALIELVMASAAFPVGFPPVGIAHCLVAPGEPATCTPAMAERALFIDGGVFDNQPLGLAVRAMRGLTPSGALPDGARFYFLDPRARTWPTPHIDDDTPPDSALDIVRLLFGMVESSAASALVSVFDQSVEIRERLLVAQTFYPQVSGTFNGLLERSFREFDFYLGMYNARRTVRAHELGRALPDPLAHIRDKGDPGLTAAWRPLLCLSAVLDHGTDGGPECAGDELSDFRILLQLTLDTLSEDCRQAGASGIAPPGADQSHCLEAMAGPPKPRVRGVRELADAERRRGEGEGLLGYQLRLLGRYRFHFRDMGLAREDAEEAPRQLIRIAHRIAQRFADEQPRYGLALGIMSRIGVDVVLGYVPPRHSLHGTLGLGAELGWSMSLGESQLSWLRVGAALGFDGLSTVFNANDDYFALIPKAGLELELFGSAAVQLRLGLRAGFQLSTADDFLGRACDFANEGRQPCSRFITESYLAVSVLGLLRFQLTAAYAPSLVEGQDDMVWVRPTLGFQLNSPF